MAKQVFESHIQGIPCLIEVYEYVVTPSWGGSPRNCPSADDYYGYEEINYGVLDRKGYDATWLEKKIKIEDDERITEEIRNYMSGG